MYPVGSQVVEFPVRVSVALLERVIRTHTHLEWNNVRLLIRKVIGLAREMNRLPIHREYMTGNVVASSHLSELIRIGFGDCAELGMAVRSRPGYSRHREVVDHPAFIPA